jgi:type IV secretory pathway TrbL component
MFAQRCQDGPLRPMSPMNRMRLSIAALSVARYVPGLSWLERSWLFRSGVLELGVKWFSVLGLMAGLALQGRELQRLLQLEHLPSAVVREWLVPTTGLLGVFLWLLRPELGLSVGACALPFFLAGALSAIGWVHVPRAAWWNELRFPTLARNTKWQLALMAMGVCLTLSSSSSAGTLASVTAPTQGGAFRQSAVDIQTFVHGAVASGQKYGSIFFAAVAVVHLPWLLIDKMFAGASDLRGYIGPLLRETTVLALFGALLTKGRDVAAAIVDLFRQMGLDIAGKSTITPQSAFDELVQLWDGQTLKLAASSLIFGNLFALMSAAVLVCCVALCVAQLWFEFESEISLDLGTIALGAGGAPWTRWMATNFLKLAGQLGLRLMVTFVLDGLLMRSLDNWKVAIELDGEFTVELLLHMLGSVLLLCLLLWRALAFVGAITTGHLSPGLDAMAMALPAGLVAGGISAGIRKGLKKLQQGDSGKSKGDSNKSSEDGKKKSASTDGGDNGPGIGDPSLGAPVPEPKPSGAARAGKGSRQDSATPSATDSAPTAEVAAPKDGGGAAAGVESDRVTATGRASSEGAPSGTAAAAGDPGRVPSASANHSASNGAAGASAPLKTPPRSSEAKRSVGTQAVPSTNKPATNGATAAAAVNGVGSPSKSQGGVAVAQGPVAPASGSRRSPKQSVLDAIASLQDSSATNPSAEHATGQASDPIERADGASASGSTLGEGAPGPGRPPASAPPSASAGQAPSAYGEFDGPAQSSPGVRAGADTSAPAERPVHSDAASGPGPHVAPSSSPSATASANRRSEPVTPLSAAGAHRAPAPASVTTGASGSASPAVPESHSPVSREGHVSSSVAPAPSVQPTAMIPEPAMHASPGRERREPAVRPKRRTSEEPNPQPEPTAVEQVFGLRDGESSHEP